jgi:hypothetical protein
MNRAGVCQGQAQTSSWVLFGLGVYWNRAVLFQIWVCLVQNWIEWSDSRKSIFGSHHFEKNYRTWALVSRDCKCVENRPIFMNVDKTGLVRFCRFSENRLIWILKNLRKFEIKYVKKLDSEKQIYVARGYLFNCLQPESVLRTRSSFGAALSQKAGVRA